MLGESKMLSEDKFEKELEELINNLYTDLEIEFKNSGKIYDGIDIYEEICVILTEMFTNLHGEWDWEFTPKYDSMQDLYKKYSIKII
jgi:hypothetical protein